MTKAAHRGRILLVEDDPAIAGMMVDLLLEADYDVDGPHASVSDGMVAIASCFPDGVVLDLHRPCAGIGLLKQDLETYDIPFLDCAPMAARQRHELKGRLLPWLIQVRH